MDVTSMVGYEALLNQMGLREELLDALPHKLSGGQLQRCSILRSLLMKSKLLLLDEPTSALDNLNQLDIMKLIVENIEGMGVLLITHDGDLARWCADEIVTLH
jgi:peptide/nickel transport system ATP-binding protein